MKIIFIFACSGMFRNVPACSGMFHVPGFIDAQNSQATKRSLRDVKKNCLCNNLLAF